MKQPFEIFKNIKKARVSSGLSQKELAEKLGVSDKTISAYETGRAFPPTPTLAKIAEITKTDVANIIGVENGESNIEKRLKNIEKHLSKQSRLINRRVKIDSFVGIVLIDKQKRIFLIKEEDKYNISQGRWNLPGGSVDNDENLTEAAVRETLEETGYKVEIDSMLGCYKCKKGNNSWVYLVFKALLIGNGKEKTDPEVKKGKWFTKKEFLGLDESKIVHSDMKLVYKIAIENRGLDIKSVKYIDYDRE